LQTVRLATRALRAFGQLALAAGLALPLMAHATMVRLYTTLGPIDVALKDAEAPISVANFLAYVRSGAYDGTFIHRNVPGFVVQGGGYKLINGAAPHIPTFAPIALEYSASRPNIRGSISMARTSELNSATSEFFLNLVDNTVTLGPTNGGGYAVFGQMTTPSLPAMDGMARLNNVNAGGAFGTLPTVSPLTNNTVRNENLVLVNTAIVLPARTTQADRAFDYLEATYWQFLKPAGAGVSGTTDAGGVAYYYRYYPASGSYVGLSVKDNVLFYLVPEVSQDITRFAPLADVMVDVVKAGY